MVPVGGKRAFSRPNWPSSSYRTMDIWSLSSLYQVSHVCIRCSRGAKTYFIEPLRFFCFVCPFFVFYVCSDNESNCQVMAVTRNTICKNGMASLSRGGTVIYYASVFLYYWVLSTPVVSLVFGSYLYICINWLHLHFDEAFSSLRIANYKAFTRFHIKPDGDLEVFTLAVDKVRSQYWVF